MAFFIAHVCLSSYLAFGVLYPFMWNFGECFLPVFMNIYIIYMFQSKWPPSGVQFRFKL
jgi:hypothetical protein